VDPVTTRVRGALPTPSPPSMPSRTSGVSARPSSKPSSPRGLVRVREVVDLMDPLAESLQETRTRVGLVLRGLPRPVSQHEVVLPGGRRVRLDLAWPRPRPGLRPVGLEYDGEVHRSITAHGRDLDRHAALDDLAGKLGC
jgi:hypothetical protein